MVVPDNSLYWIPQTSLESGSVQAGWRVYANDGAHIVTFQILLAEVPYDPYEDEQILQEINKDGQD